MLEDATGDARRYYHGGAPGLTVGSVIRPAADMGWTPLPGIPDVYRPDRVYITTRMKEARWHAANFMPREWLEWNAKAGVGEAPRSDWGAGGAVYEVVPLGPVEEDTDDYAPGVSWATPSARVVSVILVRVPLDPHTIAAGKQAAARTVATERPFPRLGRNDQCYCGSGKKFKNCHGR